MADKKLRDIRADSVPFFFRMIVVTLVLVVASVGAIGVIVFLYKGDDPAEAAVEKLLMAQILQMSLGMILGLVIVSLGVVMAWVAIEAPLSMSLRGDAAGVKGEAGLQTLSPGITLMIGGTILIGASLYLPMNYSKTDEPGTRTFSREVPQGNIPAVKESDVHPSPLKALDE